MYAINDLDLAIVENKKRFEQLVDHYPEGETRHVIKEEEPTRETFNPLRFFRLSKLFTS